MWDIACLLVPFSPFCIHILSILYGIYFNSGSCDYIRDEEEEIISFSRLFFFGIVSKGGKYLQNRFCHGEVVCLRQLEEYVEGLYALYKIAMHV